MFQSWTLQPFTIASTSPTEAVTWDAPFLPFFFLLPDPLASFPTPPAPQGYAACELPLDFSGPRIFQALSGSSANQVVFSHKLFPTQPQPESDLSKPHETIHMNPDLWGLGVNSVLNLDPHFAA